jgi:hypothetical protein
VLGDGSRKIWLVHKSKHIFKRDDSELRRRRRNEPDRSIDGIVGILRHPRVIGNAGRAKCTPQQLTILFALPVLGFDVAVWTKQAELSVCVDVCAAPPAGDCWQIVGRRHRDGARRPSVRRTEFLSIALEPEYVHSRYACISEGLLEAFRHRAEVFPTITIAL